MPALSPSSKARRRLGNTAAVMGSLLAALCLGEIGLRLLGMGPVLPKAVSHPICSANSLQDPSIQGAACTTPDPELGYRLPGPNDGFRDPKPFNKPYRTGRRVLVLGDSFAWGCCVGSQQGFVALLSAALEPTGTLVFNSGVPGYNQWNELAVLKKYYENIRPHLVVLAIYPGNDIADNATPSDRMFCAASTWISTYRTDVVDGEVKVTQFSQAERLSLLKETLGCAGYGGPKGRVPWRVRFRKQTGLGILFTRLEERLRDRGLAKVSVSNPMDWEPAEGFKRITRESLIQIRDFLKTRKVPLLAFINSTVVTERRDDSFAEAKRDIWVRELLAELGIEAIDPAPVLKSRDYEPQGTHWNERGHRKAFEVLLPEVRHRLGSSP